MQGLWLLLLPVAATCGWFSGRYTKIIDKSPQPSDLRKDYFAGLNYVLNEQPDKAVDVFIRLLKVDSDTVETHLALGNLFRRKGEVDRAIRIHQNLMARTQLDPLHRLAALSALAQDYLKAGMLDRAERLFLELSIDKNYQVQSLEYLMKIYQQEREWTKAIEVARQLRLVTKVPVTVMIAQYYCELAEKDLKNRKFEEAESYLKEALNENPQCVRATLIRARLAEQVEDYASAIRHYQKVELQNPIFMSETILPLMKSYQKINDHEAMFLYFKESLQRHPQLAASLAGSTFFQTQITTGIPLQQISELFTKQPSLSALNCLLNIYNESSRDQSHYELLKKVVAKLMADKNTYCCSQCGLSGKMLHWQCPGCQQWDKIEPLKGIKG